MNDTRSGRDEIIALHTELRNDMLKMIEAHALCAKNMEVYQFAHCDLRAAVTRLVDDYVHRVWDIIQREES